MRKIILPLLIGLAFVVMPFLSVAQMTIPSILKYVGPKDVIPADSAIVYGTFLQRLRLASDGAPQYVVLQNEETGESFALPVKPAERSKKEHLFCYYLKPGTYSIISYLWARNGFLDFRAYNDPIYVAADSLATGAANAKGKTRYRFIVMPGTLNYLGVWHFETSAVRFEDNKPMTDKKLQPYLRKTRLEVARPQIPK